MRGDVGIAPYGKKRRAEVVTPYGKGRRIDMGSAHYQ